MKLTDVLQRDPASNPLVNNGQSRITDTENEKTTAELRGELCTFVCEGQFADGMERIFTSFLTGMGQSSQKATWVSGFFGSGKSHLLKMICHIWADTRFADGTSARSLVPHMPDELLHLLRELDTAGKRSGGLFAAAGSLPSGNTDHVRLNVLSIVYRAAGLPAQYPQAKFCLWLARKGWLDPVRHAVEAEGRDWQSELNDLYVSGRISRALLSCDSSFSTNEGEARKLLRMQFSRPTSDVDSVDFIRDLREALLFASDTGKLPCTILVLDEVQQFIEGDAQERSVQITDVAEAIVKETDGHVMLVCAGQSALSESRNLQKLLDRFALRIHLGDQEVATVTRKVLLQKKPSAIPPLRKFLDDHGGEVSRQLQGTRIGESASDRDTIVDDYPLLPVRRRFWEECFRQVDAAGTQSQLRSQLRIIHDAVSRLSGRALGSVVPGDELFEALAPEMVDTGVLLRELNERIIGLSKDNSEEGRLARRICGLVFLIGRLPDKGAADLGVRATKDHIADLLVDDLLADNGKLRASVATTLQSLASEGVLMSVGDEYRLQTKEGAEWEREYRNQVSALTNNDADVQILRDTLLYSEANEIVRSVKLIHGKPKVSRSLQVHRDQTAPTTDGDAIPVWIRDGWSCSEKDHVSAARSAGTDSPILFVFVPRRSADALRKLVVEAKAAERTLGKKGNPNEPEGIEARKSIESKLGVAVSARDDLVEQIVGQAKVFQGGGTELLQATLGERVEAGARDSLVRLFPRFVDADSAAWGTAVKHARDGSDQPFKPTGYTGAIEQHPVSLQVLSEIGSGKKGNELRKSLRASPYGWPQDAIDAAIIALHRSQHISATLNGAVLAAGQLDQNKVAKADLRVEKVTLTVKDRLVLKKLFQSMGLQCKSGEEGARAPQFLDGLIALAKSTGGEPPLPAAPSTSTIEDLHKFVGNEQLKEIKDRASDLQTKVKTWKKKRDLAESRLKSWSLVERLASHAGSLKEAASDLSQVEAVRSQRLLLEPTDPLTPIRGNLSKALRDALAATHQKHLTEYQQGIAVLDGNDTWSQLPDGDKTTILAQVGLVQPSAPQVASDEAMLTELDHSSLAARAAETDAVMGRVQKALEEAARKLEPEVHGFSVERATLRSEQDITAWAERQKKQLLEAIKKGPVLIQ